MGALFAGILAVSGPLPAASAPTSLRVGHSQVLATEKGTFQVPIYIRHDGSANAVHIGLDYDEVMLQFRESWSPGAAQALWGMTHSPDEGQIEFHALFDPLGPGRESETLLVLLEFGLAPEVGAMPVYGYRRSARIEFDDSRTHFLRTVDQARIPVGTALDGGVSIYFRDALELGSGRLSVDRQEFRVPLYVTHLRPESVPFSIGLDYDEVFLSLLRVEVKPPLKNQVRFGSSRGIGRKVWIEVPFEGGIYPQLLREPLLNLVFEFQPGAGLPPDGILEITPLPGGEVPQLDGEGGHDPTEVREGKIHLVPPVYLRGDADASGAVDINDPFTVLSFVFPVFHGTKPNPCLNALDVDTSGAIDVTDAIVLLDYLFFGGSPPDAPFPEVGPSPPGTPDLGCPSPEPFWELLPLSDEL